MKKFLLLNLYVACVSYTFAQAPNLVEIEFTPPEKAMIGQFTGSPAMPIEASNIQGESVRIPSANQNFQVLFFTELSALTQEWLQVIMDLESDTSLEVHVFANDLKSDLNQLDPIPCKSMVPNCKMLSEAVFGSELGHNRAFLLDKGGIIQKVFLSRELEGQKDVLSYVQSFVPR